MINTRELLAPVAALALSACTHALPELPETESDPVTTAPSTAGPQVTTLPGPDVLCMLKYNVSTPEDAIRLLGQPGSIYNRGRDTDMFYYYEGRRITLYLAFDEEGLDSATLDNALYPECWRDEP